MVWIIRNQFSRRNLTPFQRAELALKLEPLIASKAKDNQKTSFGRGKKGPQISADLIETREELAAAAGGAPANDERIIVGDFRKMASKVSDGSLSLIFTDPPYDREASKLLDALGGFAASKLSDGGSLVLYVGHVQLPAALARLPNSI